jgi:hypothetical protein
MIMSGCALMWIGMQCFNVREKPKSDTQKYL